MTANPSSENPIASASTQDVRGSGLSVASGSALLDRIAELKTALGNLVDAVNVEFPGGMRNIGGKTGIALIQACNALAEKPDIAAIIAAQKHAHEKPLQLD